MFRFLFARLGTFLKYLSIFGTHKHIRTCMYVCVWLENKRLYCKMPRYMFLFIYFCLVCQVPWDELLNLFLQSISLALYPPEGVRGEKKHWVDFHINSLLAVHIPLYSFQCAAKQHLVQSIQYHPWNRMGRYLGVQFLLIRIFNQSNFHCLISNSWEIWELFSLDHLESNLLLTRSLRFNSF